MSICCELSEQFERFLTRDVVTFDLDSENRDLVYLLSLSFEDLVQRKKYAISLEEAEAVRDRSWEFLNTGKWCDVPFPMRKIYAAASLIKVCCTLRLGVSKNTLSVLNDALSAADDGLLLGAGIKSQLTTVASLLSDSLFKVWTKSNENLTLPLSLDYEEKTDDWSLSGVKGEAVPTLNCPSLEAFSSAHFLPQLPAKLKDCINHWPALTKWKDLSYLLRVGGGRKVPIELGSQYTQSDWSMKLCSLREFIIDHILNKQSNIGYLAQHQLFDQIPELKDDIRVPDYCCLSESDDDSDVDINAWFGPKGTVSPLHHDPKHNLLTQVLGRKRILLYNPEDSSNLYPFGGKIMSNTSEVDPESPNFKKFPEFSKAVAYECHLYPGEMLYIPPKWWHHVRALDVSFSVSFWWI